jgi:hypothetical protein
LVGKVYLGVQPFPERYPAVMAAMADGLSVSQVGEKMGAKTTCAERLRACSAC